MDYQISGYNDSKVKEICYNCNSKTAKASYNYFRRIAYVSVAKCGAKCGARETSSSCTNTLGGEHKDSTVAQARSELSSWG